MNEWNNSLWTVEHQLQIYFHFSEDVMDSLYVQVWRNYTMILVPCIYISSNLDDTRNAVNVPLILEFQEIRVRKKLPQVFYIKRILCYSNAFPRSVIHYSIFKVFLRLVMTTTFQCLITIQLWSVVFFHIMSLLSWEIICMLSYT